MFFASILGLALLTTTAAAQSRNQSMELYVPGNNNFANLAASVLAANGDAAVYKIACLGRNNNNNTDRVEKRQQQTSASTSRTRTSGTATGSSTASISDRGRYCGFADDITLTQGPSTLKFSYVADSTPLAVDCKLSSSGSKLTEAVCAGTQGLGGDSSSSTETATLTGTDLPSASVVRITSGGEKLSSVTASANSTSKSSSSSTGTGTITTAPTGGSSTGTSARPTTTSGASAVLAAGASKAGLYILGACMAFFLLL